ncbi:MAG TPA: hypothetical protein VF668_08510 [Pyrinomonadaceae bacterium]|jgi:hypothetical protein
MRRTLTLLSLLAFAAWGAACGGGDSNTNSNAGATRNGVVDTNANTPKNANSAPSNVGVLTNDNGNKNTDGVSTINGANGNGNRNGNGNGNRNANGAANRNANR